MKWNFLALILKKFKKWNPQKKFLIFQEIELSNYKIKKFLIFSQKKVFLIFSQKNPSHFPALTPKTFPKKISYFFS